MNLQNLGWIPTFDFFFSGLDPAWIPCRISRVDRGRVLVLSEKGELSAVWSSPIPMVDEEPIDLPAIGDWCAVSSYPGLYRVEAIIPRSRCLTRSLERGRRAVQVLAANVDVAFVVTGLDDDFSLRRIERYLALCSTGGVRPVLVLNKLDLCGDVAARCALVEQLAPGVRLLRMCALDPNAANVLADDLGVGKTGVFLGSSGVGKSTLINGLLAETRQDTAPVSPRDQRGQHTTTRRELFVLERGGAVIDTPGLREVGVLVDEVGLDQAFDDIAQVAKSCRFQDCRHEREPDCAVRAAAASGELNTARLESFIRLRRESESAILRQDTHARRDLEKRTYGNYRKWLKESHRLKGR